MNAIIKWTVWQRRWSTLWWSVAVAAFIFINMIFYPTFKDQAAELQKSFETLPDAAVQLFGGSTDFFSPVGFLNSQVFFIMLPLLLGILAIGMGSSLLAKEEQSRTIESLLARPVSRSRLLAGKGIAGVIILTIVTAVGVVTTLITARIVDLEVGVAQLLAVSLVCYLLAMSFGIIPFALAASGKARGASLGLGTTLAIGGYLVVSLSGTVSWLKLPSKLFPFYYYQSEAILRSTYQWANVWFFVALIVVGAAIAWATFRHRDLA